METNYTLDEITKKYNITLEECDDKQLFVSVMNGKFNRDIEYDDPLILTYIGSYYQFIKQPTGHDFILMEKYYLKAIENANNSHNNSTYFAMYNLGRYYQLIKQYEKMEKYYKIIIDNTSHNTAQYAMLALGNYYRSIKQPTGYNYELMIKYYQMTIDFNKHLPSNNKYAVNAMVWLVNHYLNVEKRFDLVKKYLEMVINNDNNDENIFARVYAMKTLGQYYKNVDKNKILMNKYLLMAIETATSLPLKITTDECLSNLQLSTYNLQNDSINM